MLRFLGVVAGPFALALPLAGIRRLDDVRHPALDAMWQRTNVTSLADVFSAAPLGPPAAVLSLDAGDAAEDGFFVSCCALRGVLDVGAIEPLARTVACLWPRLFSGLVEHDGALALVVDVAVLSQVVSMHRDTHTPQRPL
jgi:hypothetical protein